MAACTSDTSNYNNGLFGSLASLFLHKNGISSFAFLSNFFAPSVFISNSTSSCAFAIAFLFITITIIFLCFLFLFWFWIIEKAFFQTFIQTIYLAFLRNFAYIIYFFFLATVSSIILLHQ